MNTNGNIFGILLIIVILSIGVSSCNFSKVKVGEVRMMYGSNEDGHIAYDISTFTGVERGSMKAEAGQIISFIYQAVLEKGRLVIEWQDPQGEVVWRKDLSGSEAGDENIVVDNSGEYIVLIQGKGAGDKFDVSWQLD